MNLLLKAGILGREAALEGCKAELVVSHQQLASQSQQLDALTGKFTQQTAELHAAQSLVAQLRHQVWKLCYLKHHAGCITAYILASTLVRNFKP